MGNEMYENLENKLQRRIEKSIYNFYIGGHAIRFLMLIKIMREGELADAKTQSPLEKSLLSNEEKKFPDDIIASSLGLYLESELEMHADKDRAISDEERAAAEYLSAKEDEIHSLKGVRINIGEIHRRVQQRLYDDFKETKDLDEFIERLRSYLPR